MSRASLLSPRLQVRFLHGPWKSVVRFEPDLTPGSQHETERLIADDSNQAAWSLFSLQCRRRLAGRPTRSSRELEPLR
jgi:hypothetical protein